MVKKQNKKMKLEMTKSCSVSEDEPEDRQSSYNPKKQRIFTKKPNIAKKLEIGKFSPP